MLNRVCRTALLVAAGIVGLMAGNARADDAADAKGVVATFLNAVQSGDEKAMKGAVATTPEYSAAAEAYLDLMVATSKLQKAAEAKFGSSAASTFGSTSGPVLEARLKSIQTATVKIAGESAILTIQADGAATASAGESPLPAKQAGGTIILRKSGGSWKMDGASLFNLSPDNQKETQKKVALAGKLLAITNKTIQEINDGKKYAAAVDAYQAFWEQSVKAAKDLDAGSAATAPATQPETR